MPPWTDSSACSATGCGLTRQWRDLEASLSGLRASPQLLVVIPASLKDHPRVVDLLRDGETLSRLRRVHLAFGEALRKEHVAREVDALDQ